MPIKYVPFIPEPVEGQAVLGNFNRILKYKGADDVSMTLQRGMPLYEMEKQETVGENADGNMVIPLALILKSGAFRLTLFILIRPLPAVPIMPRKYISAVIPRWQKPLLKLSRNSILINSKILRTKCTAMFGIKKSISVGCMKILWQLNP